MKLQKHVLCFWMLAALLPFALVRTYIFCNSPFVPTNFTSLFLNAPQDKPAPVWVTSGSSLMHHPHHQEDRMSIKNEMDQLIAKKNMQQDDDIIMIEDKTDNGTSNNSQHSDFQLPELAKNNNNNLKDVKNEYAKNSTVQQSVEEHDNNANNVESKHHSNNADPSATDKRILDANNEVEHNTQHNKSSSSEMITKATAIHAKAKASNLGDTGTCDLSNGSWVNDSQAPPYTNNTCKYIQEHQDCMMNGRPDQKYLHWRWKPNKCELPRIDSRTALDSMRGKSMVFVGDSIARNQFQALLCALSQMENPTRTYHQDDDKENTYLFPSYDFTLSIRWSPYLIRQSDKEIVMGDNTTQVVAHLDLDVLEESWVNAIISADIVVISSGHWWFKQGVFFEEGKAVGSHNFGGLQTSKNMRFEDAYRTAWHNVLKGVGLIPGYKGITFLRSFAPEHFENGRWDTGGSCPSTDPGSAPLNSLNKLMYTLQIEEFQNVSKEISSTEAAARLKFLDITNLAQFRVDGHPNAYRMYQPFAKEHVGPIQHDCLHWCLPGPIDVWNDMLVEYLNRLQLG